VDRPAPPPKAKKPAPARRAAAQPRGVAACRLPAWGAGQNFWVSRGKIWYLLSHSHTSSPWTVHESKALATYMRKVVMPTAARMAHGIPPPTWPLKGPDEMRLPSWNHLTCICQGGYQKMEGRTCYMHTCTCHMHMHMHM
jgi:hypothetical protein